MPKQTKTHLQTVARRGHGPSPQGPVLQEGDSREEPPAPKKASANTNTNAGTAGKRVKARSSAGAKASAGASTAGNARPWRPGREKFLPVTRADMEARGWDQCDFVYSSAEMPMWTTQLCMAIITRVLEAHGYRVGVISSPTGATPQASKSWASRALGFLLASAGNMDSMVNHYSVTKHRRHTDAYTPGGVAGAASQPRGRGLRQPDFAASTRTRPSSSEASRRACAA